MGSEVNVNDIAAFFIELGVFALLARAGWEGSTSRPLKLSLAVGLPVIAAVLWGLFAAPFAVFESETLRLMTKLLVLGSGAAAGFVLLRRRWAIAFVAAVTVNLFLMYVGPFRR